MNTKPSSLLAKLICVALLACPLRANASADASASLVADVVIINANVRTMDARQPTARAIAVYRNRIVAVGSDAEINRFAGARTRRINAGGRLVLPGFNDAHVHFMSGGFQLSSVDLRDAATPAEFARRIGEFAKKLPKGRWITGGDWDHERWTNAPLPTKELIDAVTPDTPVFVNRLDGHMALANSAALRLAGVTRETKDVPGGLIVRDTRGEPTGVLKDAAMSYVNRVIPDSSFDEKLAAARAATAHAASLGVTSVTDVSAGTDTSVYQTLLARGELKTRIYAATPLPAWERLSRAGVRAGFGNDMLRVGSLKGFADGSLGSTTARFFEAYADAPDTKGLPGDESDKTEANVREATRANLHVMIHAIGDAANDEILSIFERVQKANPARKPSDFRFRIEHAQHIRPQDIARFARLGVVASMQPYHAIDDGRWAEKRIGRERIKTTYAFRALLDAGATLAFGSDWTVAPMSPLLGIYAATTRRTLDDKNPDGWVPEQKITVEEAVRAYTVGSAFAEFAEDDKGIIAPGKLADIVILSDDIFNINPAAIEKVKVLTTITDGRVVYEAN